ncbi:MAG: hypothetical protein MJ252_15025 [archaeon]|nr:hypothetical protein [archaeon]
MMIDILKSIKEEKKDIILQIIMDIEGKEDIIEDIEEEEDISLRNMRNIGIKVDFIKMLIPVLIYQKILFINSHLQKDQIILRIIMKNYQK